MITQPVIETAEGKPSIIWLPYEWGFVKCEAWLLSRSYKDFSMCPCDGPDGKPAIKVYIF